MDGTGDTWATGIDVGLDQADSKGVRGPGQELGCMMWHACMYGFLLQGMDIVL